MFSSEDQSMLLEAQSPEDCSPMLSLPHCVLEHILLKLEARDIVNFASSCSALRDAADSETMWGLYARQRWETNTNVDEWLCKEPQGIFQWSQSPTPYPGTYRRLCSLLSSLEQVVGVWRNIDDNYLWVFQWRRDHIKASKIRLVSIEEQAEELETLPISSEGLTSISFMENEHCCMSSYIVDKAKMLMMSPNKHAENACNVALGSHADVRLGSSPPGSFNHEMLQFFSKNVSDRRRNSGGRRNSNGKRRLQIQGSGPQIVSKYYLKRIPDAIPSKAHSLSGFWWGNSHLKRQQDIVYLTYDFSLRHAVIKAYKLHGGFRTHWWTVNSQAMSTPWSPEEHHLFNHIPEPIYDPLSDAEPRSNKVVAIHHGMSEHYILGSHRGRMWRFEDGSIGFLWIPDGFLEEEFVLVQYDRISPETFMGPD